ncbi:MAG: alpha/beta hydrolase [Rhodospirillales bacterium]|nr:alpha/beta hydrolase [Rhodospirillales bacterium]
MLSLSRERFRCVAYDRRARSRSSYPGLGFDFDTFAGRLTTVLETLDLTDVRWSPTPSPAVRRCGM